MGKPKHKSKAKSADVVHSAPPPPTTPAPEPPTSASPTPTNLPADDPPPTVADLQESDDAAAAQADADADADADAAANLDTARPLTDKELPPAEEVIYASEFDNPALHDDDREICSLIRRCEKQALGHGADTDRALLLECASWFRLALGLGPTDDLTDLPQPVYPPTVNAPAIGHSLPVPGDSRR